MTGAARRIGRAISLRLAEHGTNLMLHYHTSRDEAERTRKQAVAKDIQAHTIQADLSRPDAAGRLFEESCQNLGEIQVLVNNASVFEHVSFRDTTDECWRRNQEVNLNAPVQLMRRFAEQELRNGRIVNLLDWRAQRPQAKQFAYSVAKGGLADATEAAAQELAPEITVNGVAPGPILPPEGTDEEELDHIVSDLPAGRWGEVKDVVDAVLYFLQASSFVTGEVLHVDGGRHLA